MKRHLFALLLGSLTAVPSCTLWRAATPIERLQELRKSAGALVVAHRGASAAFPENTIPAFQAGVAAGADLVELDFYQSRDGVLVCFHDRTLARTTDSRRRGIAPDQRIADLTLNEIQALDAGSWKNERFANTRIPTLEAALRSITPGAMPMIEHKSGDPRKLVDLLRRLELVDQVVVQSFDWNFLITLHALEPELTLGVLGGHKARPRLDDLSRARLVETGAQFIHWNHRRLSDADLAWVQRCGLMAIVYTVNEPEEMDAALHRGLDGITTDHPNRLRARRIAVEDAR